VLIAAVAAISACACGQAVGRGDASSSASASRASGASHVVFAAEFRGRAGTHPDPSKWAYDVGGHGWGNHELQSYTRRRSNVHLDGRGNLVIKARHERHRGPDGIRRHYTSARLKTHGRFSFRYGRIAARMRVPAGRGLWPAFWMMGASIGRIGWPRCGEIDVMELLGQNPRKVYGTIHGPGPILDGGIGGHITVRRSLARGFHVYAARWTPTYVRFSLDGHAYETVRRSEYSRRVNWALDNRMFILLNLSVGGWAGRPGHATRFPARLKVDWVHVRKILAR
jgi:beta-glucanase (GH16 family)